MDNLRGVLAEHPLFHDIEPRYLDVLAGCAANVVFQPGTFLFRHGDDADRCFLIRGGRVALEIARPAQPALTLQTAGSGEVLGWSWLIPPYRWLVDARAVELTRSLTLDAKCLRGKCEADPELGYRLLQRFAHVMEQQLVATQLQLVDVYGKR